MVSAVLASLQRISSDVNGLSGAIDDVNMRQAHFESVLKAGGRIAGPKSRVWQIEHKTDGFKQNVGCGESGRHTWRWGGMSVGKQTGAYRFRRF